MGKPANKKGASGAAATHDVDEAELIAKVERETIRIHAEELFFEALHKADEELYEQYLDSREVPFTVETALLELTAMLKVAFLRPDVGEGNYPHGSWFIGAELPPGPAQIDTWARGAIPKKKRVRNLKSRDGALDSRDSASVHPSETGRSRTRSVTSKMRRQRESISGDSKSRKKRGELPDYLVPLDDDLSVSTDAESREARRQSNQRRSSLLSTPTNSALLGEMEAKKAAAEADRKRRQDEEKAEDERAAQLAKDLRDKTFVLGNDGEIIVVNQVAGDKLPRTSYTMTHSISSDQLEEIQKQAVVEDLRRETAHQEALHKAAEKAAAEAEASKSSAHNQFYRSSASFQQRILKNPALDVQAGVTIREDGSGVSGPVWEGSERQMSRTTFQQHQSMLESQLGIMDTGIPEEMASDTANANMEDHAAPVPVQEVGKGSTIRKHSSKFDSDLGDEDKPNQGDARSDEPRNSGQVSPSAEDDEEIDSMLEDPNLSLMQQSTWGQNREPKEFVPPVLRSPTRTDPHLNMGSPKLVLMNSPKRKPRDRVAYETNSIQANRLPPPFNSSPRTVEKEVQAAASLSTSQSGYVRNFETVTDRGLIRVETDRAFRMLGLAPQP